MALPNFHMMKVIFISITLRETRTVVYPSAVTNWRRAPRFLLARPGLLQALDQGNHAVVPRGGDTRPAALGGDAAVEYVDLSRPSRQHVLQHAGLVVVRPRDGLVHRLRRRAHQRDPGPLADRQCLRDQRVDLGAQGGRKSTRLNSS